MGIFLNQSHNSFCDLKNLTFLDLNHNFLPGPFPAIYNCSNLEYLDLSYNFMNGNLPDDINRLSGNNLQYLNLTANNFNGNIPSAIGGLSQLKVLELAANLFDGSFPAETGNLLNLEFLVLSQNGFAPQTIPSRFTQLSGNIPQSVMSLNLDEVDLCKISLTGKIPEDFGKLKRLSKMIVFDNNLTGELPDSLGNCDTEKLSTFIIHDNLFTGQLPDRVASNLSVVDIRNNKFTGELPTGMSTWHSLSVFRASNNLLSGQIPQELIALPELIVHLPDGNLLSRNLPSNISSWKSLATLSSSRNQLSGPIPAALGLLPNLIDLDLFSNQLSGDIPTEFGNLRLTSLNLSSNHLSGLSSCKGKTRSDKFPVKLVTFLASVAAVTFLVAVLYSLFMLRSHRKRKQGLVSTWKLTPFHKLDFTESDIVSYLTENNIIGSGGSGQVHLVPLSRSGNYVAVKRIWSNQRMDHKHEKRVSCRSSDTRHNSTL
ncbi:hypothetical protein K7X08_012174 [Anisodus acutangulus]|uniref:Uncharacterized protein n=1 Tax=Anisodus acutangulus TaxID=402998 RepID=A0A9Q1QWV0_9SOLA|nr:hypothetical protein K7X08_012174 [Anisodus acutangulus]